jgi:hypothetical protein
VVLFGLMYQKPVEAAAATQPAPTQPREVLNEKEKARLLFQNRVLERSQMLNNLKQRYSFRLQDLSRELREKAIKLNIDGMGVPGRISAREIELADRLKAQFEVGRAASDLKSSLGLIKAQMQQGNVDRSVMERVEADPRLMNYVQQVDEIDLKLAEMPDVGEKSPDVLKLQRRKAALEKKIADRRESLLATLGTAKVEELEGRLRSSENYMKELNESIAQLKQDLGDLTNQMSQYLTAKDEEKTTRDLLAQVNRQMDQLAQLSYELDGDDPEVLRRSDPLLGAPALGEKR